MLVTQLGTLFIWQAESEQWLAMYENEFLGSGSVMDNDGERIAFGTRAGSVFLFTTTKDKNQLELEKTHQLEESKIYSVHLLGDRQLLACLDQGRLFIINSLPHDSSSSMKFVLPEGKQRWPSCVLATLHHFLIGDRDGSLHLYSKENRVIFHSAITFIFLPTMFQLLCRCQLNRLKAFTAKTG